jgi:plasmid maintenance system antidote protein VapI
MNANELPSYRTALAGELQRRQHDEPGYTLREFAAELGVGAATLSEILAGKRGLSRRAARRIGERLNFDAEELGNFLDLVDHAHHRSAKRRAAAERRLKEYHPSVDMLEYRLFERIRRWCPVYNSLEFVRRLLERREKAA